MADSQVGGRLGGKVALVTGASRGIGAAVALRLAEEGAHPVLLARTPGALEEVDDQIRGKGGRATLIPLDLKEHDRIDDLAAALYQRFGRLDILVAAAAEIPFLSPLGHGDPKTWSAVMETNLTANWRLIRVMDPLLRIADEGRAIFVTCEAGREGAAYWGPYAVSKAGLEMLVRTYAAETLKTKLRVNLIDPGPVRTRLRTYAFPAEDPASLPPPESVSEAFLALALPECTRHGELVLAAPADWPPRVSSP